MVFDAETGRCEVRRWVVVPAATTAAAGRPPLARAPASCLSESAWVHLKSAEASCSARPGCEWLVHGYGPACRLLLSRDGLSSMQWPGNDCSAKCGDKCKPQKADQYLYVWAGQYASGGWHVCSLFPAPLFPAPLRMCWSARVVMSGALHHAPPGTRQVPPRATHLPHTSLRTPLHTSHPCPTCAQAPRTAPSATTLCLCWMPPPAPPTLARWASLAGWLYTCLNRTMR